MRPSKTWSLVDTIGTVLAGRAIGELIEGLCVHDVVERLSLLIVNLVRFIVILALRQDDVTAGAVRKDRRTSRVKHVFVVATKASAEFAVVAIVEVG